MGQFELGHEWHKMSYRKFLGEQGNLLVVGSIGQVVPVEAGQYCHMNYSTKDFIGFPSSEKMERIDVRT